MGKKKFTNPFRLTVPTFDLTKGQGNISYSSFLAQLWSLNSNKRHLFNPDNANREWAIATNKLYAHDPHRAQALQAQASEADNQGLWAHYGELVQRAQKAKGVATPSAASSLVMPDLKNRSLETLRYTQVVDMLQRANKDVRLTPEIVETYIDSIWEGLRDTANKRRVEEASKRLKSEGKKYWKQRGR